MWSLTRVIILAAFVAGCGFHPMHTAQKTTGAHQTLPAIEVAPISARTGQQLRIALEDRLNPSGHVSEPYYRLYADIRPKEVATDVAEDGTIQRSNIYLDSNYSLVRLSDGALVHKGRARNISSFTNQVGDYYSTYVSQQDAIDNGIEELSETLRQRIYAYLTGPYADQIDASVTKEYKKSRSDKAVNPADISSFTPGKFEDNNPTYNPILP